MISIRKSADRGKSQRVWLSSTHTFSFADYEDPKFSGFGALCVLNEDIIQPDTGFGMHTHQHMEIMTYVIDGVLEHKDSMGNGSKIRPGEIQRMSAGRGVKHSEYNPSRDKALHLLQIWIHPNTTDLNPSYEQKSIARTENELVLIGAAKGNHQVVTIHQDVKVFVAHLTKNHPLDYSVNANRKVWIQLIKGQIELNHQVLHAGDGAAVVDEKTLYIVCKEDAELLLFDLTR